MFVKYVMSIIMEGESTLMKKRLFRKPIETREKIYLHETIAGYCEESEVKEYLKEEIAKRLKEEGWGKDFSGWTRCLTNEEHKINQKERKDWYSDERINELIIESIEEWSVKKVVSELNGKQFAEYCKKYKIDIDKEMIL